MGRITLKGLDKFFQEVKLDDKPIKLTDWETINNKKQFVDSHLQILKSNSGNKIAMPYYSRLVKFYKILKKSYE